jgi:hypothetical protein
MVIENRRMITFTTPSPQSSWASHLVSVAVAGARYVGVGATSDEAVEDLVRLLAGHLEHLVSGQVTARSVSDAARGGTPTVVASGAAGG